MSDCTSSTVFLNFGITGRIRAMDLKKYYFLQENIQIEKTSKNEPISLT